MTNDADDREHVLTAVKVPGTSQKVERAFGPLGFPCAPKPTPILTPNLTNTARLVPEPEPEPDCEPEAVAEPVPAPEPQKPRVFSSSTQRIGHGSISILAGADALAELRDAGLRPERVRNFVGASGGPKWLVLHGIDRVLFPWLLRRAQAPLHVVGSSIGSWRAAALATRDPLSALERLCEEYIEQRYSKLPSPREITAGGNKILNAALGAEGIRPLLAHPLLRLHIVTARMRHIGAREGRLQQLGLGAAVLLNALDRRALGLSIERVVFDADGDPGPFAPWQGLPTTHVALTARNALAALQASAAIPGVMEGVRDPHGAPAGTYRDGGVADYHFGAEIDAADGFTLYPHFYPHLVPGWFDKALPWRRTTGLRRTIVITPSAAHVASLPGGKIPDREDFLTMSDSERITAWRHVIALGHAMGSQLMELLESDRIRHVAQPLG
jgi:hypothetical protein